MPAKAAASGDRAGGCGAVGLVAGVAGFGGRPTFTSRTSMPRVIATTRLFTLSPV
jgi:hypothetical protein